MFCVCRCVQNSDLILLRNEISHCRSTGVLLSLAAHGLVAGNDIFYATESGIDVRRQADPIIQVLKYYENIL